MQLVECILLQDLWKQLLPNVIEQISSVLLEITAYKQLQFQTQFWVENDEDIDEVYIEGCIIIIFIC